MVTDIAVPGDAGITDKDQKRFLSTKILAERMHAFMGYQNVPGCGWIPWHGYRKPCHIIKDDRDSDGDPTESSTIRL